MSKGPYYESRIQAGIELAERLKDLRYENTVILAVSEGSVVVAAQIAAKLHCVITLLMARDIVLPDGRTSIGVVNNQGGFVNNGSISIGQLEDLHSEYRGSIEQSKIEALRSMHASQGTKELISRDFFRGHTVIIVSDGVVEGNLVSSCISFLHNINTESVVLAAPIVDAKAVDLIHSTVDRQEILKVVPSFFNLDHYYDDNSMPTSTEILDYLQNIVDHWKDYEKEPA